MKKITLLACLMSLLFTACKKSDTPAQEAQSLSLINAKAVPGELVVAQANFKPTKDTAYILVGGKQVLAFKMDSNRIAFVLPELPSNTTAAIQYERMGINQQLALSVGAYTAIAQPEVVVTNFLVALDSSIAHYKEYENSSVSPLDPAYGKLIAYAKGQFAIKIAALSAEEKMQLAYTIRAYMIDPLESKMPAFNPDFFARTEDVLNDPEDGFQSNVNMLLSRSTRARIQIATGMTMMLVALGTGPFALVTSLSGAYIFLDGVNKLTNAQADSYNKSVNSVVKREEGVDAQNRVEAAPVLLTNDIEKQVVFKGAFRTMVKADANSATPLLQGFFTAKGIFDLAYSAAAAGYDIFKSILGGLAPAFPLATPSIRTTPYSKNLPMLPDRLVLNNVSNAAIKVIYTRKASSIAIKASSTTVTTETPFSFNVVYTNPTTGSIVTDKIDAIFTPSVGLVTIGSQVWMAKNLDSAFYRNGDAIPQVTDQTTWDKLTTGAWCYYNNDPATGAIYGKLYNWYAVKDARGLAPVGFHIPSEAEWTVLINYLGGNAVASGKMREAGIAHWNSPNTGATNSSGFTALPGGLRAVNYTFDPYNPQKPDPYNPIVYRQFENLKGYGSFWSTNQINHEMGPIYDSTANSLKPPPEYFPYASFYLIGNSSYGVNSGQGFKKSGYSVRCIKD